jgi:hypothetical protein
MPATPQDGRQEPRERHGEQDDHHRVKEGVVVVVREASDDLLQGRRRSCQPQRAPDEQPDEPPQADPLVAARPAEPDHDEPDQHGGQDRRGSQRVRHEAHERPADDAQQREHDGAHRPPEIGVSPLRR